MLSDKEMFCRRLTMKKENDFRVSLGYEKIHPCPNDYIPYWEKYTKDEVCPKCGASR